MARAFVAASSHQLAVASAPATVVPVTLAAWVKLSSLGAGRGIITISDGSANNRFALSLGGTNAVNANSVVGGVASVAASGTTIGATGTWAHVCAVFASATSRAAYLNGAGKGTNATNSTPTGINATVIGQNGGAAAFMDGSIAWPSVWSGALTDLEVAQLAGGLDPRLLHSQRATLIAFWRLIGASPEPDWVNSARNLTVTGATRDDDPSNLVRYVARRGQPGREVNAA